MSTPNQSVAVAPHPAVEAFKHARRQAVDAAEAPKREERRARLATLHQRLVAHVGVEVAGGLKVEEHPMHLEHLKVTAPEHVPVTVRDEGGVLKFDVRRGMGVHTFDHFGDALHHGRPNSLDVSQGPLPLTFNTAPAADPAAAGGEGTTEKLG